MIVRIEFNRNVAQSVLEDFFRNPVGTCLSSSSAVNITPSLILNKYGPYVSFWHLNNEAQIQYYGNKVSVNSLITCPGVIHANVILSDMDLTLDFIQYKLSEQELTNLLLSFATAKY
jgi:hypothetical protein